jgi:predicted nucleic acid-binding protein
MAEKPVVFFDINIILDVLQKRDPFYRSSAHILAAAETGKILGFLAAHTITTLFYLVEKDQSSADARAAITNLLQFLQVSNVDHSTIEQALNLDYKDFEDAVQMVSALQCNADYLVTRNPKDYTPPLIPTIDPAALIGLL